MCRLQDLTRFLGQLTDTTLVHVSGAVVELAEGRIAVAGLTSAVMIGDQVVIEVADGPTSGT